MAHTWYEGISHRYTSPGTKVKVICKGQGQISGSCVSKDGCFGDISVSQTHLVPKSSLMSLDFAFCLIWQNMYIYLPICWLTCRDSLPSAELLIKNFLMAKKLLVCMERCAGHCGIDEMYQC